MVARDVMLGLSYRHNGVWKKILEDVKGKANITQAEVEEAYSKCKSRFVTIVDEEYPEYFKHCPNPPFVLYYYGNLNLLKSKYRLTCVGDRHPDLYQMDMCEKLVSECEAAFKNELTIVSGMAFGIDQICMTAAMRTNAPVIAVIGSGIDKPYPEKNQGIYDYCKSSQGLVLSEYPSLVTAKNEYFVFRNRLLAAMSQILFVGAGKNKSGTSTTVRYATEGGKEVYCLPCNVTGDDLTNTLIQEGASSVLCAKDLIDVIHAIYD